MRLLLSLGAVALVLAGCVAPVTPPPPAPVIPPPVVAPPTSTVDSATRAVTAP